MIKDKFFKRWNVLNQWITFSLMFLIEIISIVLVIVILRNKYQKRLKEIYNNNQVNKLQFKTSELKPFIISSQYITHNDRHSNKTNKINQEEMDRIERSLLSNLGHSFTDKLVSNNLVQKNIYQTSDGWNVKYSCMYWLKVNEFDL